jgi:hypothetical protein
VDSGSGKGSKQLKPKLTDVLEVLKDCQTFSYNLYRIFARRRALGA